MSQFDGMFSGLNLRRNLLRSSEGIKAKLNQEKMNEDKTDLKVDLETTIAEYKRKPFVKYALKVLIQPKDSQSQYLSEILPIFDYKTEAHKIASYILKKTKNSRLRTSEVLKSLSSDLKYLADMNNRKIGLFPDNDEPVEYEHIRNPPFSDARQMFQKRQWQFSENEPLIKLALVIDSLSDHYYNTHPFTENDKLLNDDNPTATPINFFTIKRIKKFIGMIDEAQAKHCYLLQMKQSYIDEDERGTSKRPREMFRIMPYEKNEFNEIIQEVSAEKELNSLNSSDGVKNFQDLFKEMFRK